MDAELTLLAADVPRPTALGMAYEDVTLTTSDSVKIKAYVIPARQDVKSRETMMGLSPAERDELGKQAMEDWIQEMGKDDVVEVCPFIPILNIWSLGSEGVDTDYG